MIIPLFLEYIRKSMIIPIVYKYLEAITSKNIRIQTTELKTHNCLSYTIFYVFILNLLKKLKNTK